MRKICTLGVLAASIALSISSLTPALGVTTAQEAIDSANAPRPRNPYTGNILPANQFEKFKQIQEEEEDDSDSSSTASTPNPVTVKLNKIDQHDTIFSRWDDPGLALSPTEVSMSIGLRTHLTTNSRSAVFPLDENTIYQRVKEGKVENVQAYLTGSVLPSSISQDTFTKFGAEVAHVYPVIKAPSGRLYFLQKKDTIGGPNKNEKDVKKFKVEVKKSGENSSSPQTLNEIITNTDPVTIPASEFRNGGKLRAGAFVLFTTAQGTPSASSSSLGTSDMQTIYGQDQVKKDNLLAYDLAPNFLSLGILHHPLYKTKFYAYFNSLNDRRDTVVSSTHVLSNPVRTISPANPRVVNITDSPTFVGLPDGDYQVEARAHAPNAVTPKESPIKEKKILLSVSVSGGVVSVKTPSGATPNISFDLEFPNFSTVDSETIKLAAQGAQLSRKAEDATLTEEPALDPQLAQVQYSIKRVSDTSSSGTESVLLPAVANKENIKLGSPGTAVRFNVDTRYVDGLSNVGGEVKEYKATFGVYTRINTGISNRQDGFCPTDQASLSKADATFPLMRLHSIVKADSKNPFVEFTLPSTGEDACVVELMSDALKAGHFAAAPIPLFNENGTYKVPKTRERFYPGFAGEDFFQGGERNALFTLRPIAAVAKSEQQEQEQQESQNGKKALSYQNLSGFITQGIRQHEENNSSLLYGYDSLQNKKEESLGTQGFCANTCAPSVKNVGVADDAGGVLLQKPGDPKEFVGNENAELSFPKFTTGTLVNLEGTNLESGINSHSHENQTSNEKYSSVGGFGMDVLKLNIAGPTMRPIALAKFANVSAFQTAMHKNAKAAVTDTEIQKQFNTLYSNNNTCLRLGILDLKSSGNGGGGQNTLRYRCNLALDSDAISDKVAYTHASKNTAASPRQTNNEITIVEKSVSLSAKAIDEFNNEREVRGVVASVTDAYGKRENVAGLTNDLNLQRVFVENVDTPAEKPEETQLLNKEVTVSSTNNAYQETNVTLTVKGNPEIKADVEELKKNKVEVTLKQDTSPTEVPVQQQQQQQQPQQQATPKTSVIRLMRKRNTALVQINGASGVPAPEVELQKQEENKSTPASKAKLEEQVSPQHGVVRVYKVTSPWIGVKNLNPNSETYFPGDSEEPIKLVMKKKEQVQQEESESSTGTQSTQNGNSTDSSSSDSSDSSNSSDSSSSSSGAGSAGGTSTEKKEEDKKEEGKKEEDKKEGDKKEAEKPEAEKPEAENTEPETFDENVYDLEKQILLNINMDGTYSARFASSGSDSQTDSVSGKKGEAVSLAVPVTVPMTKLNVTAEYLDGKQVASKYRVYRLGVEGFERGLLLPGESPAELLPGRYRIELVDSTDLAGIGKEVVVTRKTATTGLSVPLKFNGVASVKLEQVDEFGNVNTGNVAGLQLRGQGANVFSRVEGTELQNVAVGRYEVRSTTATTSVFFSVDIDGKIRLADGTVVEKVQIVAPRVREAVIVRVYGLGAAAPALQVAGQGPLQAFSTSALGASAGQFAQYSLLLPLQNKGEPAYRLSLPTSPGRHVEFTLENPGAPALADSSSSFARVSNGVIEFAASGALPGDSGSSPVLPPASGVLFGADRFATNARVVREAFKTSETVFVASGETYADALSAGAAAAKEKSALVLARKESIDPQVLDVVRSLGARKAVVVGGSSVLGTGVETALKSVGVQDIERVAGVDRAATSLAVAGRFFPGAAGALYVSAWNFPDALSASSAGAHLGLPVVLVSGANYSKLPGASKAYLVGGTAVLANPSDLSSADVRLAGPDRYATSLALAKFVAQQTNTVLGVAYASGANFPDALSASNLTAKGAVVLLADGILPAEAANFVAGLSGGKPAVYSVGGGVNLRLQ